VEELKDEANLSSSKPCSLCGRHGRQVLAVEKHRPLVRKVKASGKVEKRRLPRAASAYDGDELAMTNRKVHTVERRDDVTPLAV
jgi:hypothetical protein